jgi:hypothetical protein
VMKRNVGPIHAAGAFPEPVVILTDETSPWGADVYIEVTRDIPGANMATISGTFCIGSAGNGVLPPLLSQCRVICYPPLTAAF